MHCNDCKGNTSYVVCNVITDIAAQGHFGEGPMRARLSRVHVEYKQHARDHNIHDVVEKFSPENFNFSSDAIHLTAKAAATRKCTSYCLLIAQQFNSGSAHDRVRLGCIWGMNEYNRVVAESGKYLTDEQIERLILATHTCMNCFYWLRQEAVGLGMRKRWVPKPKNHQWVHLVEDFVRPTKRNPRTAWCYADEDFVGRMRTIMRKVARKTLALRTMQKYVLLWGLFGGMVRDGRVVGPIAEFEAHYDD